MNWGVDSIREELESTVTPLLRDILEDARKLARDEAELVRAEVRDDATKVRQAVAFVFAGSVSIVISILFCALMLAELLTVAWLKTPLWMSYGIVATLLAGAGWLFSYVGGRRLDALQDSSRRSLQAFREGFGWMHRTM